MNRGRPNDSVELYPGIRSADPKTLRMLERMALRCTEKLNVTIRPNGAAGSNAIVNNFYQLMTVAGFGMNPTTVPPVHNRKIREELKLVDGFESPRERRIFKELVKIMFGEAKPAKLKMRRTASTGLPRFVNKVSLKKGLITYALGHLDRILTMLSKGQLEELYDEFEIVIAYALGERTQADTVIRNQDGSFSSKDREVNDEEAARTALEGGTRRPADKRIFIDTVEIKNHFAGRRRTVYGMSFVINYLFAAFFSQWREVYLERYAFTWKHRTREEKQEKINRYKYQSGFDVKQFDQSVADWMVDAFTNDLKDFADERFCSALNLAFKCPYVVPYPYITGTSEVKFNPLFGANPLDADAFDMFYGLPSGIACVPDCGKLFMMWQYLVIADRYFHNVLEVGIAEILMGEHDEYAFLNMGDDCVAMTNHEGFALYLQNNEYESSYFKVEQEQGTAFLGDIVYEDDAGSVKTAANMVSYLVNKYVPEFGIDHPRRKNTWAIGMREQANHYSQAPAYGIVHEIEEEEFYNAWGQTPNSFVSEAYESQKRYAGMSFIDLLVMQKPEYLYYRFDERDVSPEIMAELITSIPAEDVWKSVKSYIRY